MKKLLFILISGIALAQSPQGGMSITNLQYGTATPTSTATDKKNDTYIQTSNGTSGGLIIAQYKFDGVGWFKVVGSEDEVNVTGATLPIAFPVSVIPGTPVFSPATPSDATKLYSITNGTAVAYAKWNGTQYIGVTAPTTGTPFYLLATTTDANSNKILGIERKGTIAVNMGVTAFTTPIYASGLINDFFQYDIKNTSTGTAAQSGYSATSNTGTGTNGFVWIGKNNSTFNNPQTYNVGQANDGTILNDGGNLLIHNTGLTGRIAFATGSATTPFYSERMNIQNNTGFVGINVPTPVSYFHVGGQATLGINANNAGVSSSFLVNSTNVLAQTPYTGTAAIAGQSALRLIRPGLNGTVFNSAVDFKVGKHSTSTNGTTVLTIAANDGATHVPEVDIATFTSAFGGRLGIGTTNPLFKLHILDGTSTGVPAAGNGFINSIAAPGGARFINEHNTAASNAKVMLYETISGKTKFSSLTDTWGAFVKQNIIAMDHTTGNVGIGTETQASSLQVNGSFALPFTSTAVSLTATSAMYTINCNNLAVGITITLPTPVGISGRIYIVKRDFGSTGSVSVTPTAGQIEGLNGTFLATTTLQALGIYGQVAHFQSDGVNWHRIN
jgi:hypothetical protein